jgi:hypothetical protein
LACRVLNYDCVFESSRTGEAGGRVGLSI